MADIDDFDHDSHMQRAIELAREAAESGNRPFGSVLVRDDEIVMEDTNAMITENDIRRHPELNLARLAVAEWDAETRRETVMYTSTEPCAMCAGGIRSAELARVVYSVGSDEIADYRGSDLPPVRSADILDGVTEVVGPVLNDDGWDVHHEYL